MLTNPGSIAQVVHMFHGGLWGGWQYQLRDQDSKSHSLLFSHGNVYSNLSHELNLASESDTPNFHSVMLAIRSHSLTPPGGYQEGRGSGIRSNHYFVENIFEELDAPGEWFHDPVGEKLYFWPNTTQPFKEVVAPIISAIVRVQGAEDVSFQGTARFLVPVPSRDCCSQASLSRRRGQPFWSSTRCRAAGTGRCTGGQPSRSPMRNVLS